MPNIGPMELLVVGIIALIVLGPKRLPEVGRSLGKGMREFKDSLNGLGDDEEETKKLDEKRDEQQPVTHA
ncbi:MAG TPA: twin-arginine translocase TatA/TatE family subunit [Gaiellaceae bacterium]|jgi:sec-independent protein translocase protein TatA|nr:twin-arginine translocase TatA/TatE family subunit [Gaiellaceae bacterium]